LEGVVLELLQVDKVRQEVTPLQVFHLTLPQFVVVEVEVVDLQEQIQELMVDQVVVDLRQVDNQHKIILEQVFVDKVILVGAVLMLRLLV
jgi:NH3-dependent NAD+ synthetase